VPPGENETARLYIALPCPSAATARLSGLQSQLLADTWSLKFSDPQEFHLTLHFLGQTPIRVLDDLRRELGAVAHARRPFDLRVQGLGAFPSWEDPRILWAGIRDPSGKLADLHQASLRVLNAYRLFKLPDAYTPHITLARVKKISAAWDARRLQVLAGWEEPYPVEELRLMRSRPGDGFRDEVLGSFKLLG
jgi:RNA 2',3'-cyclic 3'-phosphodiesterase